MERYIEYQVQAEELSMEIGKLLRKKWKLSSRQISRLKFRREGICVNGCPVRVNHVLRPGDQIRICLEQEEQGSVHLEATPGIVDILYEDADLLVVNKRSGVPVHPSHGHYKDTLANHLVDHYRRRGQEIRIRPVGRLDKDTSGLVLFAKHQVAAARLSESHDMKKEYLALVHGCPNERTGFIDMPIAARLGALNQMVPDQNGKPAVTHYEVIQRFESCSLLRLWLEHGRTHQIRVHMAMMGHALLGDAIYGMTEIPGRAALHCERMNFLHPFTDQAIEVTAPIPGDMERIIQNGTIEL